MSLHCRFASTYEQSLSVAQSHLHSLVNVAFHFRVCPSQRGSFLHRREGVVERQEYAAHHWKHHHNNAQYSLNKTLRVHSNTLDCCV